MMTSTPLCAYQQSDGGRRRTYSVVWMPGGREYCRQQGRPLRLPRKPSITYPHSPEARKWTPTSFRPSLLPLKEASRWKMNSKGCMSLQAGKSCLRPPRGSDWASAGLHDSTNLEPPPLRATTMMMSHTKRRRNPHRVRAMSLCHSCHWVCSHQWTSRLS